MEDKSKKNSKVEIIEFNDFIDTKEEKPKLSEEEKEEIKKQLTRLLTALVIFGTIFLTTIIFINLNKSNDTKKQQNKNSNKPVEENIITNKDIHEGEINTNDESIKKYKNILTINSYDTIYYTNLKNIFLIKNLNGLDNDNKLYLATKSESFNKYLEDAGILDHEYGCVKSTDIEFDPSVMQTATEEVFGPNFSYQNNNFIFPYYINGSLTNVYNVTFSSGKYTMKCIQEYNKDLKLVIQTKFNKITKINNQLVFELKTVFIDKEGVYSDPNTTKIITNNTKSTYEEYINKGQIYKFIFEQENDNYYLKRIE